jgi:hypothetical protein
MPRGCKIRRYFHGIGRRSRQRAHHNSDSFWSNFLWSNFFWANRGSRFRHMSNREVPQAALDPVARHSVPDSATDDEANTRTGAPKIIPIRRILVRRIVVRNPRGMNDKRGPTRANPAPSRALKVLRPAHPQQSRQHWIFEPSGGQSGAALATPGRNDRAAGAGPHPQAESMGTAATPITRLERALGHGKTPKPSEWSTIQVRCSHGTHRRRGEQVAAAAMEATF